MVVRIELMSSELTSDGYPHDNDGFIVALDQRDFPIPLSDPHRGYIVQVQLVFSEKLKGLMNSWDLLIVSWGLPLATLKDLTELVVRPNR